MRWPEDCPPEDIVNIHFASKDFSSYEILLKLEKETMKGQRISNKIAHLNLNVPKEAKMKVELEKQLDEVREEIKELRDDYLEIDHEDLDGKIKNAFITFRSMEGAARLYEIYNKSFLGRCFVNCSNKVKYQSKLFFDKWLKVEDAIEPSLI